MELLSTSEIAEKWNVSRRRVTTLCIEGRIDMAVLSKKQMSEEDIKLNFITPAIQPN